MKPIHIVKTASLFLILGGAITLRLSPQIAERLTALVEPASAQTSRHYEVVSGSIYDGDTFRVTDGRQEIKVRLCGVDSPEKDQALGIEARDHLRGLIARGKGQITLVETDTDRYGRTIAEAFIPTGNGDEEIYLNGQMVTDGMAYVYPQYVGSCPNGSVIETAEAAARREAIGVWANPTAQKPWDYRHR